MKKFITIILGSLLTLGSIFIFFYGTALLATANTPPNIQISNPNIIMPEAVSQNWALSVILGSTISGFVGLIILIFGILLRIPTHDLEGNLDDLEETLEKDP